MGCWTLTVVGTKVTAQVEGIEAPAEREPMHLKGIQLKGLVVRSELKADPDVTGVGLERKQEAQLRVEELGTAERTGPRWALPDIHWEPHSREGTTRSRRVASRPAVDAAAAAEMSGQRFESSVVSMAVVSAVESSYGRQWAVLSHLVESRRHLRHVDLYDKATGEDGGL